MEQQIDWKQIKLNEYNEKILELITTIKKMLEEDDKNIDYNEFFCLTSLLKFFVERRNSL